MSTTGRLRTTAYVLLGDPHYLAESVRSYYDAVDRVVACYDVDAIGWGGAPLDVDGCLADLRAIDRAGKVELLPGAFHHPDRPLLESDTAQRQVALDAASEGADWVLQLDADEIALDADQLLRSVGDAAAAGAVALDYPSRWLFARTGPGHYVEAATRLGRPAMSYPGPLAVRAGTRLVLARQQAGPRWRVDVRRRSTDPAQPQSPVHDVVRLDQAVLHFSWVRPRDELLAKSLRSGHARDFDWTAAIARWDRVRRHPWRYALGDPLRRGSGLPGRWLRPVRLPVDPDPRWAPG